jgi:DNA invertase Pin-like site-specific DNA recombinase
MDSDFAGHEALSRPVYGADADGTKAPEDNQKANAADFPSQSMGSKNPTEWFYKTPVLPATGMVDVIYARKSSDKQREDSIVDQDRRARMLLAQRGFDPSGFMLFADSDESGLLDSRPEFDRLWELICQKRIRTVAVIHQDRFSRGVNVVAMLTDLKFNNGRFLSLDENLDSNVEGWEFIVGMRAAMNHEFIKNLSRRSREGSVGRLLDGNGSAGDFPYAFASVPIQSPNPKRNRRPKARVVIEERAAALVVMIFVLFADQNNSVAAICRWVDEHRHEYPPLPAKGPMYAAYIRAILRNPKYIGRWWYGATKTMRDSKGKKRFAKVAAENVLWIDRPDLRIVPQDLWERAQAKLAKLKAIYGLREGQRKRGPREHYRGLYAKKLLPALTFCSACGSSMLEYASADKRLNCKGYRQRICKNNVTLPYTRAEAAVLRELEKLLKTQADWVSCVVSKTKE